jgi:hypothetical protein
MFKLVWVDRSVCDGPDIQIYDSSSDDREIIHPQ